MHKSLQEFDFWHIQTADIVELIGPEKTIALLLENYSKYFNDFTWWLSGERSLPFGLLVLIVSYCWHNKDINSFHTFIDFVSVSA